MATILKFEPRKAHRTGAAESPAGVTTGGQIVIFPGIRIERDDFMLSDRLPPPPSSSSGVRRKRRQTTGK